MQGYYKCEKCNILIDVITTSRNSRHSLVKAKIKQCPQCEGKLKKIEPTVFHNSESKLYLNLARIYNYKHVGDRRITMKVKFL